MSGPGHERAAGRAWLRASHADREQVIETLKVAFVQGRLTQDELDGRAGQALTARTYAELSAVTADLPAGMTEAPPARAPGDTAVRRGVRVIAAATVPAAGLWAAVLLAGAGEQLAVLLVMVTVVWLGIVILTGAVMLAERSGAYMYRPPLTG